MSLAILFSKQRYPADQLDQYTMSFLFFGILAILPLFLYYYVRNNDKALERLPPEVAAFSPQRCTADDIRRTTQHLAKSPISVLEQLPPKTGRRYIVVGGVNIISYISVFQD